MSVIICYAPSNDSSEERKDEHYDDLHVIIDEIPERDMKTVMSDHDAIVGRNNEDIDLDFECPTKDIDNKILDKENGKTAVTLMENEALKYIGGYIHKTIHEYTWTSPCGNYKNQIDHVGKEDFEKCKKL
ncbi:uncharacterized protein [Palaemon carinicauda]|uniref:uncharacterized protein n=1 Tax=Palaemon carinicauda TaxID=392227 RepID=UPI0035B5D576